jgi:hypothetical protein
MEVFVDDHAGNVIGDVCLMLMKGSPLGFVVFLRVKFEAI